ncbi:kinase-like protein [Exidia glandulosa HHB12029]|uniref:Kinase-like protein n=1 Tax=Exidia glandulosa HHB12029 TaxID=1314781 RepID=A0A165ZBS4_EXIGL|nr:kinase-like protein [Exidia glandulosa HHB12029]
MTDSRGHAAGPTSFHDDASTLTREPFYVVLPSSYETPEEFQLEIPTNGNDDILELTHKLLVSVVHQSNPRLLWTDVAIETSFWNLSRNHDECTASHSHAYLKKTVGDCLQQIKAEVQKDVDAVDATWARRASPQALLASCFPMAARSIVSQLGQALVSDHADTIVYLGPVCLRQQEQLENSLEPVQDWLRRRYVLNALQLQSFDDGTGDAFTELKRCILELEDAVKLYEDWLYYHQYASDEFQPGLSGGPDPLCDDAGSEASEETAVAYSEPECHTPRPEEDSENSQPTGDANSTPKKAATSRDTAEECHLGQSAFPDLTDDIFFGGSPSARGASSVVHRGTLHQHDGVQIVAVKVVQVCGRDSHRVLKRLRRELHIWSRLKHRNILPIIGIYRQWDDTPSLVSPWCAYGNVCKYIDRQHAGGAPSQRITLTLDMLDQLLEALRYLHEHEPPIVHGDLKGDNIFVTDDGVLQLSDFGLSRTKGHVGSLNLESSNSDGRGTVRFMSREQIDRPAATVHSDMWASSCVFVEVIHIALEPQDVY